MPKELMGIAASLSDSMAKVNDVRAETDQAIADAKAGVSECQSITTLRSRSRQRSSKKTISGVLDSLNGISSNLDSAVSGLIDASGSLAKGPQGRQAGQQGFRSAR